MSAEAVNATFRNVVILRTWRELNGEEKIPEGSTLTLVIGGGDKIKADTLGVPTVEEGWF